jgi:hypothetical protein
LLELYERNAMSNAMSIRNPLYQKRDLTKARDVAVSTEFIKKMNGIKIETEHFDEEEACLTNTSKTDALNNTMSWVDHQNQMNFAQRHEVSPYNSLGDRA